MIEKKTEIIYGEHLQILGINYQQESEGLCPLIEAINEKKKEIEVEHKYIQKRMKQLRKTSPKSFMESVEVMNTL